MGELGIYSLEDISYSLALDDIEERASKYSTIQSKQYRQKFVPSEVVPDVEGVNSDEMSLGYLGDGEWVLLKPGSIDMGTAATSHLGAYTVLNETELNVPDMDYSEGQIVIEHLGDLESPISAIEQDPDNYNALVEAIAGKAILGDNDIGGNIGFSKGECYLFDFDRAGSLIRGTEAAAYDYIRRVDRLTDVDACLEDVELAMERITDSINIAKLEASLSALFDSIDQDIGATKLSARDFTINIEDVKGGEFFNSRITDKMEALDAEVERRSTDDKFRKNMREAMLD